MQQNRRGGNGWVGWLIFILIIFGPRFLPPVANWLSQVTGLQISTPMLVAALVGLGVVSSIIGSITREVGRSRGPGDTRLPTGLPPSVPPPTAPTAPLPPPRPTASPPPPSIGGATPMRLPSGEQRLPGPPRFEPIIDPRILKFGIYGLIVFGGIFMAVLYFSGSLP